MTTEEKGLLKVEDISKVAVFTSAGMKPILDKIKSQVSNVVTDVTTLKGREECKSRAFMVTKTKVMIKDKGLELIAPDVERVKSVKSAIKMAEEVLTALSKDTRAPLTEWEDAEKIRKEEEAKVEAARIEAIRKEIGHFSTIVIATAGENSVQIQERIYGLEEEDLSEERFGEYVNAAQGAVNLAMDNLKTMLGQAKLKEAAEAKLAADQKELEEKKAAQKIEDDKREARLKEEQEKLDRDKAALAEREAELKAKEEPKAEEVAETAPVPLGVKMHTGPKVNAVPDPKDETLAALAFIVNDEMAHVLLDMIVAGEIPHVAFTALVK